MASGVFDEKTAKQVFSSQQLFFGAEEDTEVKKREAEEDLFAIHWEESDGSDTEQALDSLNSRIRDYPLSSFETPPSSPQNPGSEETPSPFKRLEVVVSKKDLGSLSPGSRAKIQSGFRSVAERVPKREDELASRVRCNLMDRFAEESGENPVTPEFHRKAHSHLQSSNWISGFLAAAERHSPSPTSDRDCVAIIHAEHVFDGEVSESKIKGKHLFSVEDIQKYAVQVISGGKGGVFGVYWKQDKLDEAEVPKFSTSFPSDRSAQDVIILLRTATFVAKQQNRSLWQNGSIWMESYHRPGEIRSVFPLFHVDEYAPERTYTILPAIESSERVILSSAQVQGIIGKMLLEAFPDSGLAGPNPIRFVVPKDQACYYDIGSITADQTGIKSGIFIKFPNAEAEKVLNNDQFKELLEEVGQ